jgi:hypothetical protein
MIFESTYRRQAMQKWNQERSDIKEEIKQSLEQKKSFMQQWKASMLLQTFKRKTF